MNTWISLFWAACALMACWSFSLFVRLISETVARKRKRLAIRYSKRATRIALGLMVLCGVVSVVCGKAAFDLHDDFNQGSSRWVNAATVVGWSVAAFGVLMLIWWIVGDRARGRVRCPKCWYDMSAAAGLQCPECGKIAKGEAKFGKARRPRWMVVMAVVLMGSGWYGVLVGPRVAETEEWLAAVPTWVLMVGWEVLPEEWIYDDWSFTNPQFDDSCLEMRLDDYSDDQWVSDRMKARFGRRLIRGMTGSAEARWDPVRLVLINSVDHEVMYRWNRDREQSEWIGLPSDAELLFRLSAVDMIEAVTAENPSDLQIRIMERISEDDDSPYRITRGWIWSEFSAGNDELESEEIEQLVKEYLPDVLHGLDSLILSEEFRRNLVLEYTGRAGIALQIGQDAGLFDQLYSEFLTAEYHADSMSLSSRVMWLSLGLRPLKDEELALVFSDLARLAQLDDPDSLYFAARVIMTLQRLRTLDSSTNLDSYHSAYEAVVSNGLDNLYAGPPDDDGRAYGIAVRQLTTIHQFTLTAMAYHDLSGTQAYPLIREQLLTNPAQTPQLSTWNGRSRELSSVELWFENFSEFVESDNEDIRYWIISNLPTQLGTEYDDRLDRIAMSFLGDVDEDLDELAQEKLRARLAEQLIYQAP